MVTVSVRASSVVFSLMFNTGVALPSPEPGATSAHD
jgi:hypothetical protein